MNSKIIAGILTTTTIASLLFGSVVAVSADSLEQDNSAQVVKTTEQAATVEDLSDIEREMTQDFSSRKLEGDLKLSGKQARTSGYDYRNGRVISRFYGNWWYSHSYTTGFNLSFWSYSETYKVYKRSVQLTTTYDVYDRYSGRYLGRTTVYTNTTQENHVRV